MSRVAIGARREDIPELTVAHLCAISAGCCQFKGCRKFLFETPLTMSQIRQGHVAHIVAASEDGPRGVSAMTPEERKALANLMLMCREHHNEIDTLIEQYPVELLTEWKKEHEDRIKLLRNIGPDQQRQVIAFNGLIGDHRPEILSQEIKDALLSFYSDGHDIKVDFSRSHDGINPSQLESAAQKISQELGQLDREGMDNIPPHPREVFAIASIPLLVHLGSRLSNKVTTRIHNRHRTTGWRWNEEAPAYSFHYHLLRKDPDEHASIALLISVSAKIDLEQLPAEVANSHSVFELTPLGTSPILDLVQNEATLQAFVASYRQVIAEIRGMQPKEPVKIFIAAPAAVAVSCGFELLDRGDPMLHVYDLNHSKAYQPTLLINRHVQ